jgi:hypothetical protein
VSPAREGLGADPALRSLWVCNRMPITGISAATMKSNE